MFSAKGRKKSIGMTRPMRMLPVFLAAVVTLLVTAPELWAIPFSRTKIIIEVNATGLLETIEVLADRAAMQSLRRSIEDGQAGRWVTNEDGGLRIDQA